MDVNTKAATTAPEEPDWSLLMFWEDITAILAKLFDLFKSFFA